MSSSTADMTNYVASPLLAKSNLDKKKMKVLKAALKEERTKKAEI